MLSSEEIKQKRLTQWMLSAQTVTPETSWTETRQAIQFGPHTYLLSQGQVFQCVHCGHYDPEWKVSEVLQFFNEVLGIKPIEITVTCRVGE